MADNALQEKSKAEIAKDFRVTVTEIENAFRANADGCNIIVGTKDNPIVPNNEMCSTESIFAEGVYAREMFVKKGCVVIGAIHKHDHISFLTSGSLLVASEAGMKEYEAPCVIVAGPGVKRIAYANEDSTWWNVHGNPSNTKDLKELEKENIVASYEEYEEYIKNK
tara:strand:- start:1728 stop:2225 length:498 start_codon:yes stop_codon:yes gene_type:complete